jgi:hypothetical protein
MLAFRTVPSPHSFSTAHDCPGLPTAENIYQITLVQDHFCSSQSFDKSAQLISEVLENRSENENARD